MFHIPVTKFCYYKNERDSKSQPLSAQVESVAQLIPIVNAKLDIMGFI